MDGANQVWQLFFPRCQLDIMDLSPEAIKEGYHIHQRPFVYIPRGNAIATVAGEERSLLVDSVIVHVFPKKEADERKHLLIYVAFDRNQGNVSREHYYALTSIMAFKRTFDRKLSVVEFKEPDYSVSKKQTPTLKFGHSLAREPLLPFEASPEMLVDWGKLAHATYMHNPQPDFLDKIHGRDVTRRSPSMHAQIDVIPNDELEVKSIHTSRDFLLLPGIPLAITASSRHPQTGPRVPWTRPGVGFPACRQTHRRTWPKLSLQPTLSAHPERSRECTEYFTQGIRRVLGLHAPLYLQLFRNE